jgi:hypothetical protein
MEADIGYADRAPCENTRNGGKILELMMISYGSYYRTIEVSVLTQANTLLAPEETLRYVSREMEAVMPTQ